MKWHVKNNDSLIDELLEIRLTELPAKQKIRISAETEDEQGGLWQNTLMVISNSAGEVLLDSKAIERFFCLMRPLKKNKIHSLFSPKDPHAFLVKLKAMQKKQCLGETIIIRRIFPENIQQLEIKEENVTGIFYFPKKKESLPAILLVPGSRGVKSQESLAALLASKGYAVFVVAYYRYQQLPDEMYELPLERFRDSITWLKSQSQVDAKQLFAMGLSKGAEAVLAALSYFPDMQLKGVIAQAPSHVVWQGIGKGRPEEKSSWTLFSEPLAYANYVNYKLALEILRYQYLSRLPFLTTWIRHWNIVRCIVGYQSGLQDKCRVEEARIPVEKMKAPLLLISGKQDLLWPSSQMAKAIKQGLEEANFSYPVKHLDFASAGHLLRYPGLPTTMTKVSFPGLTLALGGDPVGLITANQDYWRELLDFLKVQ